MHAAVLVRSYEPQYWGLIRRLELQRPVRPEGTDQDPDGLL